MFWVLSVYHKSMTEEGAMVDRMKTRDCMQERLLSGKTAHAAKTGALSTPCYRSLSVEDTWAEAGVPLGSQPDQLKGAS